MLTSKLVTLFLVVVLTLTFQASLPVQSSAIIFPCDMQLPKDWPVVYVYPSDVTAFIGEDFTVSVIIYNLTDGYDVDPETGFEAPLGNLYGLDIEFSWDPAILQYVDHTITVPFEYYSNPVQPSPYPGILHEPVCMVKQMINEGGGIPGALNPETRAWFACASMLPAASFNGYGTVFTMTFNVVESGNCNLELLNVGLSDVNGESILFHKMDGSFTPPVTPYFLITASPTSLIIQQDDADTSTITIESINSFNQPVQLSVSGAPSGVTTTLNPEQVTPPLDGSTISTLTVSVDTTVTTRSYTLTVTGTSDALTYSTYISLEIKGVPVLLVHGAHLLPHLGLHPFSFDPRNEWKEMAEALAGRRIDEAEQVLGHSFWKLPVKDDEHFTVYVSNYADGKIPTKDDIRTYAMNLANEIQAIKNDAGVSKVDIVAHSMGGLVARAYIESEDLGSLEGHELYEELRYHYDVRKFIMLGTPNHGVTTWILSLEVVPAGVKLYSDISSYLGDHLLCCLNCFFLPEDQRSQCIDECTKECRQRLETLENELIEWLQEEKNLATIQMIHDSPFLIFLNGGETGEDLGAEYSTIAGTFYDQSDSFWKNPYRSLMMLLRAGDGYVLSESVKLDETVHSGRHFEHPLNYDDLRTSEWAIQMVTYVLLSNFDEEPIDLRYPHPIYHYYCCPVNVTITDEYGRIIDDQDTNEIPSAYFTERVMEEVKIFQLPPDLSYNSTITAYKQGNFTLIEVIPAATDTTLVNVFGNIPITNETKATIEILSSEALRPMAIDYNGDGVVDEARHPDVSGVLLLHALYTFSIVWGEETFVVSVESNSTVSNFAFNQPDKEISFNVTGPDGTIGFCNVTIPKALLYGEPWTVLIDGALVSPTITENATHDCLYFTYTHSTHTIQIIGTWIIGPPSPPLSASINPLSASILVGQSVTFTSTVTGGVTPYTYQWYLNGNLVSGATSDTWTFTPTASGIYYVYLKVTDAEGNTTQSETARITVTAVPVGGYSVPIQTHTRIEPITPYIALITIMTALFVKVKRKTRRKR